MLALQTLETSLNQKISTLKQQVEQVAEKTDLLDNKKFNVSDVPKLGINRLKKRLAAVEYELRTLRESQEITSAGYRNALKATRSCVVDLEPAISQIVEQAGMPGCSIFIRDFRTLDDKVTVLGDLLSREFAAFLKARTGLEHIYREEYVIHLYQQKKLKVPAKEAFNLENLEKGGFPTHSVLIISGRLTETLQVYRLDVEVTNLKDPQFRASSSHLIPRDQDVNRMYETILRPEQPKSK